MTLSADWKKEVKKVTRGKDDLYFDLRRAIEHNCKVIITEAARINQDYTGILSAVDAIRMRATGILDSCSHILKYYADRLDKNLLP